MGDTRTGGHAGMGRGMPFHCTPTPVCTQRWSVNQGAAGRGRGMPSPWLCLHANRGPRANLKAAHPPPPGSRSGVTCGRGAHGNRKGRATCPRVHASRVREPRAARTPRSGVPLPRFTLRGGTNGGCVGTGRVRHPPWFACRGGAQTGLWEWEGVASYCRLT